MGERETERERAREGEGEGGGEGEGWGRGRGRGQRPVLPPYRYPGRLCYGLRSTPSQDKARGAVARVRN